MQSVLKDGTVIQIDAEDAHLLSNYSFRLKTTSSLPYVRASKRIGGKPTGFYLSRLIASAISGQSITFANKDRLDFRRMNLIVDTGQTKRRLLAITDAEIVDLYIRQEKSVLEIQRFYLSTFGEHVNRGTLQSRIENMGIARRSRSEQARLSTTPAHLSEMSRRCTLFGRAKRRRWETRFCSLPNCGKEVRRRPSDFAYGRCYCSDECQHKHQSILKLTPVETRRKKARERAKIKHHVRRARIALTGGSFTSAEWRALCEKHGDRCLACGEQKPLTQDHVIPIVKGGRNDIGNIQPLCLRCNLQKGTMIVDYRPDEF